MIPPVIPPTHVVQAFISQMVQTRQLVLPPIQVVVMYHVGLLQGATEEDEENASTLVLVNQLAVHKVNAGQTSSATTHSRAPTKMVRGRGRSSGLGASADCDKKPCISKAVVEAIGQSLAGQEDFLPRLE